MGRIIYWIEKEPYNSTIFWIFFKLTKETKPNIIFEISLIKYDWIKIIFNAEDKNIFINRSSLGISSLIHLFIHCLEDPLISHRHSKELLNKAKKYNKNIESLNHQKLEYHDFNLKENTTYEIIKFFEGNRLI